MQLCGILQHDDVIKWDHFPRYWPFVRGIHRASVNSPHKGQRRAALMFSLICVWIHSWVNNGEAGDFRRHRAHYDVIVMAPIPRKYWQQIPCCSVDLGRAKEVWLSCYLVLLSVDSKQNPVTRQPHLHDPHPYVYVSVPDLRQTSCTSFNIHGNAWLFPFNDAIKSGLLCYVWCKQNSNTVKPVYNDHLISQVDHQK